MNWKTGKVKTQYICNKNFNVLTFTKFSPILAKSCLKPIVEMATLAISLHTNELHQFCLVL